MAAFAQVQSLTETLSEYIRVSTHQEISAVSTSLCDECHKHNQQQIIRASRSSQSNISSTITNSPSASTIGANASPLSTATTSINTATFATVVRNNSAGLQAAASAVTTAAAATCSAALPGASDRVDAVLVDDDGYCEIDELRLPTVLVGAMLATSVVAQTVGNAAANNATPTTTPELKRQSTISADSIPEETEHEIHAELIAASTVTGDVDEGCCDELVNYAMVADGGHVEINDTYDTTSEQISECIADDSESAACEKPQVATPMMSNCFESACSANRLAHATSLAPAVPCHLITNYVNALSLQISQLLVSVVGDFSTRGLYAKLFQLFLVTAKAERT